MIATDLLLWPRRSGLVCGTMLLWLLLASPFAWAQGTKTPTAATSKPAPTSRPADWDAKRRLKRAASRTKPDLRHIRRAVQQLWPFSATQPSVRHNKTSPPPSLTTPKLPSMSMGRTLWTQGVAVLFALTFVVVLLFLILRWVSLKAGTAGTTSGSLIKIHQRATLEPKKTLWVVEAADQYFLLASHEQGVTLINTLEPDKVKRSLEQTQSQPGSFWQRLRQASGRSQDQPPTTAPPSEPPFANTAIPTDFEVLSDGQTPKHAPSKKDEASS